MLLHHWLAHYRVDKARVLQEAERNT